MSQINVNSGPPVDTGERSSAAGFNMVAVLLALVVAVVVVWLLFAGLFGLVRGGGNPVRSNQLMRWRVILQGAALLLFMLLMTLLRS